MSVSSKGCSWFRHSWLLVPQTARTLRKITFPPVSDRTPEDVYAVKSFIQTAARRDYFRNRVSSLCLAMWPSRVLWPQLIAASALLITLFLISIWCFPYSPFPGCCSPSRLLTLSTLFYTIILVITFTAVPHRIIIVIHHVASRSSVASSDEQQLSSLSLKESCSPQ